MKHTPSKSHGMRKHMCILPIFLIAAVALILGATALDCRASDEGEVEFDEAHLFFELNNTDGDLGIHALIDGEAWKSLEIEDPRERRMLNIRVNGRLRKQGLTEIFFESAEPTFDELPPEKFFRRFPEGIYEIEGITLKGDELESEVELTHTMPAPPLPTVNGQSMAVQCDEDEEGYDATEVDLNDDGSVTIEWDPVTMSHSGLGTYPPKEVIIHNYEVVVEVELETDGEEFTSVFSVILPSDKTSVTIPSEFIALGDEFKYEVLAREESYNQTAVESCFKVE